AVATRVFSAFLGDLQSCADRKIPHALAAGCKNGIGQRGRRRRQADLARTGRVALTVDDCNFDVRGIGDAQQRVVVEVALHHLTFLDGDLQVARGADAVDRSAHHLRFEAQAVDRPADIDCTYATFDSIAAVAGHAHFHRVRGIAAESEMPGDAEAPTSRHTATPTDALRGQAQHIGEST